MSALVLLTVCSVAGCGLLPGSSSDLEDALEVVPDDATSVTYVGRAAAAERAGVDDVETGADEADIDRYLGELAEAGASKTRLTGYLAQMQEAAFSDLDLEWEVSGEGDEGLWVVWKLDDDVDLDDVGDDLVDAGYEESEVAGARSLRADLNTEGSSAGMLGDRYPIAAMMELVLLPDEHLIISGPDVEAALDVATDETDSLVDAQDFEEVVGAADEAEFAYLRRDIDCAAVFAGGPSSPEEVEELTASSGLEDLARPEATGFFVHGEDAETTTVLAFADGDAAEADAKAREAWLDGEPMLVRSRQPFADDVTWDVETDGSLVRIDHDFGSGRQATATDIALEGDGFALCAP